MPTNETDLNAIDRYLSTLESRMKHLPKARRDDDLREIRSHLETLVAGFCAQGCDDREAVQAAIRQFGHADDLASQLNRVWIKQIVSGIPELLFIYLMCVTAMMVMYALTGSLEYTSAGLRTHLIEASLYSVLAIMPSVILGGYFSKRWQKNRKGAQTS